MTDWQVLASEVSAAWWRYVARRVARHMAPHKPRKPTITQTSESGPVMRYKLTPAAPTAADVVTHEISLTVDNVAAAPILIPVGQTVEFEAAEGVVVMLSETQIDDAGNRSEPSEILVFTAADTIAPAKPGQPTVELIGE